jgi:protein-S-isoprenylcysteine O-methyltransferase Ste14
MNVQLESLITLSIFAVVLFLLLTILIQIEER